MLSFHGFEDGPVDVERVQGSWNRWEVCTAFLLVVHILQLFEDDPHGLVRVTGEWIVLAIDLGQFTEFRKGHCHGVGAVGDEGQVRGLGRVWPSQDLLMHLLDGDNVFEVAPHVGPSIQEVKDRRSTALGGLNTHDPHLLESALHFQVFNALLEVYELCRVLNVNPGALVNSRFHNVVVHGGAERMKHVIHKNSSEVSTDLMTNDLGMIGR